MSVIWRNRWLTASLLGCLLLLVGAGRATADRFFDEEELRLLSLGSLAQSCQEGCRLQVGDRAYSIGRVPSFDRSDERQAFLVADAGWCGNAGCVSAVILREPGRVLELGEGRGLTAVQAQTIVERFRAATPGSAAATPMVELPFDQDIGHSRKIGEAVVALSELEQAIGDKIRNDLLTIAEAFWTVYDLERSRWWADIFGAPLTIVEQAVGAAARIASASDIRELL